jgi:hypothetical protein
LDSLKLKAGLLLSDFIRPRIKTQVVEGKSVSKRVLDVALNRSERQLIPQHSKDDVDGFNVECKVLRAPSITDKVEYFQIGVEMLNCRSNIS